MRLADDAEVTSSRMTWSTEPAGGTSLLHGPRPGKCLSRPIDPGQVAPLRPPSRLAFGENEGFLPKNGGSVHPRQVFSFAQYSLDQK